MRGANIHLVVNIIIKNNRASIIKKHQQCSCIAETAPVTFHTPARSITDHLTSPAGSEWCLGGGARGVERLCPARLRTHEPVRADSLGVTAESAPIRRSQQPMTAPIELRLSSPRTRGQQSHQMCHSLFCRRRGRHVA